jgi:hypothetical protein
MNQPFLKSSPELPDSALDLRLKDSAQLDSPSLTPPQTSSASIGSQVFQTSEMSPQKISAGEFERRAARLIALQEAFRASLRQLSEPGVELPMSDGSGLTQSASLASYDQKSRSLRIRQLSLLWKMDEPTTELCRDWPRTGMTCCGHLFRRPCLVPAICVGGSSFSQSVPTLDTQPMRQNPNANAKKWDGNNSVGSLALAKLLPTTAARDYKDSLGMSLEGKDGRIRDDQLPRAIFQRLLPTITAKPDQSSQEAREVREARGSKPSSTLFHALLPTAKASEREGRQLKRTPSQQAGKHGKSLAAGICEAAQPESIGGLKLSPEFLCWFMGFPPNWLKPLQDAPATQYSPKSPKRSPEPSKHS